MSIILDGTNGISDVDGSASTPAIRGTDANTGIFFPAADTIAFAEGGAEVARFDSSGNLGIGTSSPSIASLASLNVKGNGSNSSIITAQSSDAASSVAIYSGNNSADNPAVLFQNNLRFGTTTGLGTTGYTERARITSGGDLLINQTSQSFSGNGKLSVLGASFAYAVSVGAPSSSGTYYYVDFRTSGGTQTGYILSSNGTGTTYSTTSDYRLKENIAPMTGALNTVMQLKPCTYTWKINGVSGQGFIAHELQEIVPDCVTGEKDAMNEDGSIKPQGVDTSFLVATLTAAIQELKSELDAAKARIAVLEAK